MLVRCCARRAVLITPGAVEQAVVDHQVLRRGDDAYAVAGGVDHAAGDERVLPVAAGDAVVARGEIAADDLDVAAGLALAAAEVHAVPPARAFDPAHEHLAGALEHHRVIGRVANPDVAQGDVPAVTKEDRVRPAHVLLATRIEDLVAVDLARPDDAHVLDLHTQHQGPVPAAARAGLVLRRGVTLVLVQVCRTHEHRARLEQERDAALELHRAGEIASRRHAHLATPGARACLDGLVDGRLVKRGTVAPGTVIAHVHDRRALDPSRRSHQGNRGEEHAHQPKAVHGYTPIRARRDDPHREPRRSGLSSGRSSVQHNRPPGGIKAPARRADMSYIPNRLQGHEPRFGVSRGPAQVAARKRTCPGNIRYDREPGVS